LTPVFITNWGITVNPHIARVSLGFIWLFSDFNGMYVVFGVGKKYNCAAAGLSPDFTAHPG
jgi:hypothetical protein